MRYTLEEVHVLVEVQYGDVALTSSLKSEIRAARVRGRPI